MRISGFKKQSLIDFPGNISSVIFTQGCNFRCGYCHNPDLVLPKLFGNVFEENKIFDYLSKYSTLLDAVCITGGEPTIHKDLPILISRIKELGLKIKLDSNGTNPEMIKNLIDENMIDFIAMDIKHILEYNTYNQTVGHWINKNVFLKILKSIDIIQHSEIDYEFRTTVANGLHSKKQIRTLKTKFGTHYKIQNFNPEIVLDPNIKLEPFSETQYRELLNI